MTVANSILPVPPSKITVPRPPPGAVDRPRCRALLEAGREYPLTLVSASAGWGKTTLLSQWAEAGPDEPPVAWLTLGREDDDRRRMLTEVTASVAHALPGLASLGVPPKGSLDDFLAALLGAVAGAGGVTLVLDGLERVRSVDALRDIDTIATLGGASVSVVVATRFDPSLGLERRRLAGDLFEVRARDLAFDLDEATEVLTTAGVKLEPVNRALLLQRTEGWPAAMALATMALDGHAAPDEFVRTFSGNDRAVSDYLTSEVLNGLDPAAAELLVCTSIVDPISEDLAAAVLGDPAGGRPLAELAHSDGIVSSADEHGLWYRYHPLLAAVLQTELRRRPRAEVAELRRRAADWFSRAGMLPEAVRQAVAAEDWDLVADLLGDRWLTRVVRGEGGSLRAAMGAIPPDVLAEDAEIALAAAGVALDAGDVEGGTRLLERSTALGGQLPSGRRARFERALSSYLLTRSHDVDDLEQALSCSAGPEMDGEIRALVLTNLGAEAFWLGRSEVAARSLEEAAGLAQEAGNDFVLVAAHGYLAAVYQLIGRTREARALAGDAIALAAARGWAENPQVAIAYVCDAVELATTNQPEEAKVRLERARAAIGTGDRQLRMALATCRARLLSLAAEPLAALEVLRAAGPSGPVAGWQVHRAARLQCKLLLQAGQAERARRELEQAARVHPADTLASAWAHLALAEGDPGAALGALAKLAEPGTGELRAEVHALRAMAHEGLGDAGAADAELTLALDAAEPPGYRTMFGLLGGSLIELLRRHARRGGTHAAFADELVAAGRPGEGSREPGYALLEPLSERELAVLRFLPTMLPNTEIASELFISVNTVKTHLRHIYRKLGVADRRQAVRRGRQLHLLNPGLAGR